MLLLVLVSTLVTEPAESEKAQGSHWGSNQGPPALAAGALTTELRLPTAT